METQVFDIRGMSCSACVKHIARALTELKGVESAAVSLPEEQATVTYAPTEIGTDAMIAAVAEEGYEAIPRSSASN